MTTSAPHVTVIVNHTKEMSYLFNVLWRFKSQHRFHFLWLWFDALFAKIIAEVFQFVLGKVAFADIRSESRRLQTREDCVEFLQMIIVRPN